MDTIDNNKGLHATEEKTRGNAPLEIEDIERMLAIAQQRGAERRRARALEAQANGTPDFYDLAVRLCADIPATRRSWIRGLAGLLGVVSVVLLTLNAAVHAAPAETAHPTQNAAVEIACNDMCNADEVYANTYACLRFNPIQ